MNSRIALMSASGMRRGRPRDPALDARILRAAIATFRERGVEGTTVNAVARRAGVARATIYLRYPSRDLLITAAIRAAIGREPIRASGDIERDLHRAGEQGRAVFSSRPFQRLLPRLIDGLLQPKSSPTAITYDMLAPNRMLLVEQYRALAEEAGLRTDVDPELVADVIIGALMNRLLVTGQSPSTADAEGVVTILLEGLRVR